MHVLCRLLRFPCRLWIAVNFSVSYIQNLFFQMSTRLKKNIENNLTWEGAFYQSAWIKTNWSWVTLVFSLHVCCCYCIRIVLYGSFSKYWTLFIPIYPFILNMKFYMHVNSPAWADKNQFMCVFSRKWVKLTQDELFSILKNEHFLGV